ncbi:hypothetical protein ZIOFF_016307 [Zingiber officinale]|uniref:Uncharacterized protein n=1 Tax=Zingiber officinale TaxID=94328 RepID=A0A8J5HVU1_ZINOF|nr:hypothetical protein ZIOFF_016307 [Zingiber officinale]
MKSSSISESGTLCSADFPWVGFLVGGAPADGFFLASFDHVWIDHAWFLGWSNLEWDARKLQRVVPAGIVEQICDVQVSEVEERFGGADLVVHQPAGILVAVGEWVRIGLMGGMSERLCLLWSARNDAKHCGLKLVAPNIIWRITQYIFYGMAVGIIKQKHWKGFSSVANSWGIFVRVRAINTVFVVHWKKPIVGGFKLNTDGCSKGNPGLSYYGVIVRDHGGNMVLAQHGTIGIPIPETEFESGFEVCSLDFSFRLRFQSVTSSSYTEFNLKGTKEILSCCMVGENSSTELDPEICNLKPMGSELGFQE